jgi:hypothetical protein
VGSGHHNDHILGTSCVSRGRKCHDLRVAQDIGPDLLSPFTKSKPNTRPSQGSISYTSWTTTQEHDTKSEFRERDREKERRVRLLPSIQRSYHPIVVVPAHAPDRSHWCSHRCDTRGVSGQRQRAPTTGTPVAMTSRYTSTHSCRCTIPPSPLPVPTHYSTVVSDGPASRRTFNPTTCSDLVPWPKPRATSTGLDTSR